MNRVLYILLLIIVKLSCSGNFQIGNDTVYYFAFGDSVAIYKSPDDTREPKCYISWRDTLLSNNYFVVHYTDALTHIEKLDKKDSRVEYGWWEWANVKILGFDSVWIKQEWNNISLKDYVKYSPSGKYHSFHQCYVGDGFWTVSPTVILDSNKIRISPICYHKDDFANWVSNEDIMLFSQYNYKKQKFGNNDYYLQNDLIYVFDAFNQDTSLLSYGYAPVYSKKSKSIIFLKENLLNEAKKVIQLCSIGLDGNSFKVIKTLNISDYGLIESNCMDSDGVRTTEIQIQVTESSEQYKFELFYIYDCDNYIEEEETKSMIIVIDSNGELVN